MAVPPARPAFIPLATLLLTVALLAVLGPTADPVAAASRGYQVDVIAQAATERAARSLPGLVPSDCLDRFAHQQAREMARSRRLGHQDLGPVLAACDLQEVGENVAFGYPSGAEATAGWMASTAHRDNLLAAQHTRIGVGAHQDRDGRWYVSEVLAAGRQDHQQRDQPLGRDLVPALRRAA